MPNLGLLPRVLALLDGAETCRRAVEMPLLEVCSWVWCMVVPTVYCRRQSDCRWLCCVAVAGGVNYSDCSFCRGSPMVLGLGGLAVDILNGKCVEGITPKEPVWLAGEGILCRTVMGWTSHFPSFSRLVWSCCEPEAIMLGTTGWRIS